MDAYIFWNNVDLYLKGESLITLSEMASLNYKTLKNQRSLVRLPKLEEAFAIAQALNVPVETLVTGKEIKGNIPPRLQTVVDILSKNSAKLEAVETLLNIQKKENSDFIKEIS